jgi:hypothetical protein
MKTTIITLLTLLSFNLLASDFYPLKVTSVKSTRSFPSAVITLTVMIGCGEDFAGTVQTMQGNTNVIGVLAKTKEKFGDVAVCLAFQEKTFSFSINTESADNGLIILGE